MDALFLCPPYSLVKDLKQITHTVRDLISPAGQSKQTRHILSPFLSLHLKQLSQKLQDSTSAVLPVIPRIISEGSAFSMNSAVRRVNVGAERRLHRSAEGGWVKGVSKTVCCCLPVISKMESMAIVRGALWEGGVQP